MKAKLNLSSITSLVAQHVEKVVLALVCVLALVLVWGGIATSGGLDWEPTKLASESTNAENHIDSIDVDEDHVPDWKKEAKVLIEELKLAKKPIPSTPYEHPNNWVPGVFDERSKRDVPPLFAVEDLRAAAGRGAVRMAAPGKAKLAVGDSMAARGGGTLGQRWVVITGSIPFDKQHDAYKVAFRGSYEDPTNDVPSYIYYRVERAQVDPSGGAAELQWERLNVGYRGGALAVTQLWTSQQSEIVAPMFILIATPVGIPMAFPLAPVTNRQWGPEVAHEPDIPFYYDARMVPETDQLPMADKVDEPGVDEPGRRPRGLRGRSGAGMMPGMPGMEEMNPGMGPEMTGMGAPGAFADPRAGMRLGGEPVPVRLFRFFDFNVAPGKSYRYRVRLMLANPNQDVPPEYLAQAGLRDVKYLETEFCDPTDAVTIPLDSRLLCVNVKTSVNLSVEPSSHMMSVRFDPETGEESATEHEKLYRGQLANFFEIPVETAPAAGGLGNFDMMMPGAEGMDMMEMMAAGPEGGRNPDKGRRKKPDRRKDEDEEAELVDHITQHIVLDMQGGQRIGRDLTAPSSMLLLDSSGRLVVRSDLNDLEEYLIYHVPEEEPRKTTEEDPMGAMDDMMMMGGQQ